MKKIAAGALAGFIVLFGSNMALAAEIIDLSHVAPGRALQLEPGSAIKPTSQHIDFNRTTHARVYQTYEGYRIWGSDAIFHTPTNGGTPNQNGFFYRGLKQDLVNTPAYIFTVAGKDKASKVAMQKYAEQTHAKFTSADVDVELVVYIDAQQKAHWAYEVKFMTSRIGQLPARPVYVLDAVSFETYEHWNDLKTSSKIVNGGGIGGNGRIGKVSYDGLANNRPAFDITREAATNLCTLQNETVIMYDQRTNKIPSFRCATPNAEHNNVYWNTIDDAANGGYSPINDGIYSDKIVREMYMKWFNLPFLVKDGKPMQVKFHVHDQEQGQNAFYYNGEMVFGEGDDESYPIVAPSVVAHEMSHGFTEQHSNLQYHGQSGGINEAFSDMADKSVEYYMYGNNNWDIDAELLKDGGRMLRYMDEPTKDCGSHQIPGENCSIDHMKDYTSGTDVHHSSGIFNKAFYLIASKWNTQKAFNVMVQANVSYWTPNATFVHAACGVLKATRDYKYDEQTVRDAMKAVGVSTAKC